VDFVAVVDQVIALLRQRGRVTYRTLQIQCTFDDAQLAAMKDALLYSHPQVVDDAGRGVVWTDDAGPAPLGTAAPVAIPTQAPLAYTPPHLAEKILTSRSALEGERTQVTVLFCDRTNATPLAERLGPEAMHTLLHHFFARALAAMHRYEGTMHQCLGRMKQRDAHHHRQYQ